MFERTLESLIKGLRSHRGADEVNFVSKLSKEIRDELKSGEMEVKAGAVLKLTYLQMLGYPPASYSSFSILEVMASSQYHLKQIGYLAASHSFNQGTDVLILATNLVKKDLHSANPLEVAVALNGLSHIVTPDLAQHLLGDIVGIMNHSRPAIRKKAILVLYSIIQKYPEALSQGWHRLQERLEDSDPGVVSAAVNIICELGRTYPKKFLPLSPQLFELLTSSSNNWMLIKIVKLFGTLTPHEPRLIRKLLPPIKSLISTTPALSLLYECINSVISGEMLNGPGGDELAETCIDKLAAFLDDQDRNLRYISLLALTRILPTHPHLVAQYQDSIMRSIDDQDLSIRLRALDLAAGMASRRNLRTIVSRLLKQLYPDVNPRVERVSSGNTSAAENLKRALTRLPSRGGNADISTLLSLREVASTVSSLSYRAEVCRRILEIGRSHTYANVEDFEWYLQVLTRLVEIPGSGAGSAVRDQIIEITARFRASRPFAAKQMLAILENQRIDHRDCTDEKEVLQAAAWVCGEYWEEIGNPRIIATLLLQTSIHHTSASTISICLQNAVKLVAHWLASLSESWDGSRLEEVKSVVVLLVERMGSFTRHSDCEVSERAVEFIQLFEFLQRDLDTQQASVKAAMSAMQQFPSSTPPLTPPTDETMMTWGDGAPDPSPSATPRKLGPRSLHVLAPLFSPSPLGPVGDQAQSKVPVPKGLDLVLPVKSTRFIMVALERKIPSRDEGSNKDIESQVASSRTQSKQKILKKSKDISHHGGEADGIDQDAVKRAAERRKARQRNDPFYLNQDTDAGPAGSTFAWKKMSQTSALNDAGVKRGNALNEDDLDDVPIVQLSLEDLPPGFSTAWLSNAQSSSATKKARLSTQEQEEMPEGADDEDNAAPTASTAVDGSASGGVAGVTGIATSKDNVQARQAAKVDSKEVKALKLKKKKSKRPKATGIVLD